jgi:replicative DNA helicase
VPPVTIPDLSAAQRAWSVDRTRSRSRALARSAPLLRRFKRVKAASSRYMDWEGLMDVITNPSRSKLARQLLAAMLWRQQPPDEHVRTFVRPDDLFPETYQRVYWAAYVRLATADKPLNCSTLGEQLSAMGSLAASGGPRALSALARDGQGVTDDLVPLLYDLRDAAVRERMLHCARNLAEAAEPSRGFSLAESLELHMAQVAKLSELARRQLQ